MAFPKKVAILTLSVGAGHLRAAEMIERALACAPEQTEARVLDAVELGRAWFRQLYVESYWWMLRRAPGVWRRLFELRQRHGHRATIPHWVFRHGCRGVLDALQAFAPQLVISTEIGAAEIAALSKREGWLSAPLLAVLTDFRAEPPWVQREIDFYCVATDEAKSELVAWGVSPNRILVCGIPIDPAFALGYDKSEVRKALGLAEGRPVVLVMGGGMGPVPLDEIVVSLELCGLPLQVLAVSGQRREMQARVESLRGKVALDLHPWGWTENVPELMAAADLLITKPGGLTTAEAMAMGLPMLLTHPIPGPEERNLDYLTRRGVALAAETLRDIPELAFRILRDSRERERMVRRARDLARPEAAYTVAQVGRALLEKAGTIDRLSSPPARLGESAYLM
jgi:processive 1,2-diacylglycerol beta-glucosyltransferase